LLAMPASETLNHSQKQSTNHLSSLDGPTPVRSKGLAQR
jgi:hypothetical protein